MGFTMKLHFFEIGGAFILLIWECFESKEGSTQDTDKNKVA